MQNDRDRQKQKRHLRLRSMNSEDIDLHLVPPQGFTPVEFRGDVWRQKTRVPGLSRGVVCVILLLAVLLEHRLVTQTQARTDRHRPMASTGYA